MKDFCTGPSALSQDFSRAFYLTCCDWDSFFFLFIVHIDIIKIFLFSNISQILIRTYFAKFQLLTFYCQDQQIHEMNSYFIKIRLLKISFIKIHALPSNCQGFLQRPKNFILLSFSICRFNLSSLLFKSVNFKEHNSSNFILTIFQTFSVIKSLTQETSEIRMHNI